MLHGANKCRVILTWAFLVSPSGLPSEFFFNCAENDLELITLLSVPFKSWDYKHMLPCLAYGLFSYPQIKSLELGV